MLIDLRLPGSFLLPITNCLCVPRERRGPGETPFLTFFSCLYILRNCGAFEPIYDSISIGSVLYRSCAEKHNCCYLRVQKLCHSLKILFHNNSNFSSVSYHSFCILFSGFTEYWRWCFTCLIKLSIR